jgi:hypothetical protein
MHQTARTLSCSRRPTIANAEVIASTSYAPSPRRSTAHNVLDRLILGKPIQTAVPIGDIGVSPPAETYGEDTVQKFNTAYRGEKCSTINNPSKQRINPYPQWLKLIELMLKATRLRF